MSLLRPRRLFGTHAMPRAIVTTHTARPLWPWLAAVAVTVALGALHQLDAVDARQAAELAAAGTAPELAYRNAPREVREAFELGRNRGHAEMFDTARAGWEAAVIEAERCRAPGRAGRQL